MPHPAVVVAAGGQVGHELLHGTAQGRHLALAHGGGAGAGVVHEQQALHLLFDAVDVLPNVQRGGGG